jgi:hypothetical protein
MYKLGMRGDGCVGMHVVHYICFNASPLMAVRSNKMHKLSMKEAKSTHYQSGQSSRRLFPSSSGASCCFIQRSGTYPILVNSSRKCSWSGAYNREITLHRAQEALSVLSRADNRWFAFVGATSKESRIFDPAL